MTSAQTARKAAKAAAEAAKAAEAKKLNPASGPCAAASFVKVERDVAKKILSVLMTDAGLSLEDALGSVIMASVEPDRGKRRRLGEPDKERKSVGGGGGRRLSKRDSSEDLTMASSGLIGLSSRSPGAQQEGEDEEDEDEDDEEEEGQVVADHVRMMFGFSTF